MDKLKFEDWEKVEIKTGTIKSIEDHPNADKLYILKVNIGDEEKQFVAGLRKHYTKEELKGKQAIFLTNLEPVILRGIKSEGMILAAGDKDKLSIFIPDRKIPNGCKLK